MLTLSSVDSECFQSLRGNIGSSLLKLQHLHYLDLSQLDFGGKQIPEFIGSLTKLRFLDLSSANLSGTVPYQLGNLTNLQYLNIGDNEMRVRKLEWLSNLHKLKRLNLESLNLEEAADWLQVISGLPSLRWLHLASSILPTIRYPSLSLVNSSTSLEHLDLSSCGLTNSAHQWLFHVGCNLLTLVLTGNQLQGPIPDSAFSNMTSLLHLYLSFNQITGISKSFGNFSCLRTLDLYNNNLTGQLPDLFFNLSGRVKKSLESLDLYGNMLSGSLPDITEFSSLRELDISLNELDGSFPEKFGQSSPLVSLLLNSNQLWGSLPDLSVFPLLRSLDVSYNLLNGTVNKGLGQLSMLERLDLSSNSLQGTITEVHMSSLSKLKHLEFSDNSQLALNFSPNWVPPFQLDHISLRDCKLGPHFPKWLRNQKNYSYLDISEAGISDTVPTWFWDLSPNLYFLNVSYNHMKGRVSDLSLKSTGWPGIDLSFNSFEGSIPPISPNVTSLNLSKNNFSGSISSLCAIAFVRLTYLDLSENQLSGEMPDYCRFWPKTFILNLANNNFSSKIPNSMDPLCQIISLHLQNNSLTGELPSSLRNCTQLSVIDLKNNRISGTIPTWIGDLSILTILTIRSNHVSENLPPQLCNLTRVQVLDFSQNNVSGKIPKCLNKLTAMLRKESSNKIFPFTFVIPLALTGLSTAASSVEYQDQASLVWKGVDSDYKNILGLVKSIDLSSNQLFGEIPEEITGLVGLISLNLSRNSLTGPIPPKIGRLTFLNSLDLSQNQLNGTIPESFSHSRHLGVLNLSDNNLSGKIPSSTQLQSFDASAYIGNPELCGLPLPNKCPGQEPATPSQVSSIIEHESEDDRLITRGFYVSMVIGFIICFWEVGGTLLLNRK
ncbi:Leucine-rich repeat receptor protein kinase [Melia azedarach]|uniref:Leucine-rich repeat receptor protein kinase n=1 Tax=Melia azedarach TaxID=155640 RepID=A0ACC1X458_MELAZ|nr:Leucine-rich repeat receptor protein kinase [Melia azedarach]